MLQHSCWECGCFSEHIFFSIGVLLLCLWLIVIFVGFFYLICAVLLLLNDISQMKYMLCSSIATEILLKFME